MLLWETEEPAQKGLHEETETLEKKGEQEERKCRATSVENRSLERVARRRMKELPERTRSDRYAASSVSRYFEVYLVGYCTKIRRRLCSGGGSDKSKYDNCE